MRQIVILHGWSDTSESFHPLAKFLKNQGFDILTIWLGDYISMEDDVHVSDVAKRMDHVITQKITSGELNQNFDMIVHSTGGLVAREWIVRYSQQSDQQAQLKRLIMLAPANYGSKLAATGKSMLGRITKGYDNWFHIGQSMLDDLELSSQYQWDLAQRDILIPYGKPDDEKRFYGKDLIWPFVITGSHPYTNLLRRIVNENGSDGTIRVCAANLNAKGATLDFTQPLDQVFQQWASRLEEGMQIPFAVLPTRTHGSIVDPGRVADDNQEGIAETAEQKNLLGQIIVEALNCNEFETYKEIHNKWWLISESTAINNDDIYHQYLQLNTRVFDELGGIVEDYFLEFLSNAAGNNDSANVYLHKNVIEDVKANSKNPSLRNLFLDRTDLFNNFYQKFNVDTLLLSMSAAAPGKNVKYFNSEKEGAHALVPIHFLDEAANRFLARNTTHFIDIIIPRTPGNKVFSMKEFDSH